MNTGKKNPQVLWRTVFHCWRDGPCIKRGVYAVERRKYFWNLKKKKRRCSYMARKKQQRRRVVFPFAHKVESLQQPECTVLHWADKHSCWWVTCCKLAGVCFSLGVWFEMDTSKEASWCQTILYQEKSVQQHTKMCHWKHRRETDNRPCHKVAVFIRVGSLNAGIMLCYCHINEGNLTNCYFTASQFIINWKDDGQWKSGGAIIQLKTKYSMTC